MRLRYTSTTLISFIHPEVTDGEKNLKFFFQPKTVTPKAGEVKEGENDKKEENNKKAEVKEEKKENGNKNGEKKKEGEKDEEKSSTENKEDTKQNGNNGNSEKNTEKVGNIVSEIRVRPNNLM